MPEIVCSLLVPVCIGKNSYVLEYLVAQPPDVEVVANVFDKLKDKVGLIEALDVVPRPFPDLTAHLTADGRAKERRRAIYRVHQWLDQTTLLKLVRRYLPNRRPRARATLGASGDGSVAGTWDWLCLTTVLSD